MGYIDALDIFIAFIGIIIRFKYTMRHKIEQYGDDFKFSTYFDYRHKYRWGMHVVITVVMIITLPEFIIEYVVPNIKWLNIESWSIFLSFCIGVIGYDSIKILEKVGIGIANKLGINLNE